MGTVTGPVSLPRFSSGPHAVLTVAVHFVSTHFTDKEAEAQSGEVTA